MAEESETVILARIEAERAIRVAQEERVIRVAEAEERMAALNCKFLLTVFW